jgi:hypothetical protein
MSVDVIGWHRHWSSERFFGEEDVYGPMPECAAQEAYSFWFKGGGYWPLVLRTPIPQKTQHEVVAAKGLFQSTLSAPTRPHMLITWVPQIGWLGRQQPIATYYKPRVPRRTVRILLDTNFLARVAYRFAVDFLDRPFMARIGRLFLLANFSSKLAVIRNGRVECPYA